MPSGEGPGGARRLWPSGRASRGVPWGAWLCSPGCAPPAGPLQLAGVPGAGCGAGAGWREVPRRGEAALMAGECGCIRAGRARPCPCGRGPVPACRRLPAGAAPAAASPSAAFPGEQLRLLAGARVLAPHLAGTGRGSRWVHLLESLEVLCQGAGEGTEPSLVAISCLIRHHCWPGLSISPCGLCWSLGTTFPFQAGRGAVAQCGRAGATCRSCRADTSVCSVLRAPFVSVPAWFHLAQDTLCCVSEM